MYLSPIITLIVRMACREISNHEYLDIQSPAVYSANDNFKSRASTSLC